MKYKILLLLMLPILANSQVKVFLSPKGNDNALGDSLHPLLSPGSALKRAEKLDKDITLCFYPGTFELTEPINIHIKHSRELNFIALIPGKTVLSGGTRVTGFIKTKSGLYKKNIKGFKFEQLYVNGKHAVRARYPNADRDTPVIYLKSLAFDGDPVMDYPKAIHIGLKEKLPFVAGNFPCEMIMIKDWATLHKQVLSLDSSLDGIQLNPPFTKQQKVNPKDHNHINALTRIPGFSCFFEGNIAFLDQPGEWAIQGDELFYLPEEGVAMENAEVIIPRLSTLVNITADSLHPAVNVHFEGLIFSCTSHMLPVQGHDGTQAAVYYNYEKLPDGIEAIMPAAVELTYAKHCSFTNCEFSNLGSSGLRFGRGCKDNQIDRCTFYDIVGNGVMIGTMKKPWSESFIASHNIIQNSIVHECAWQYPSGVGIWIGYGSFNEILHNEIYDLPYTGISNGWQWNPFPTPSHDNKIKYNHVHDVMKVLGDGGGIYVLGNQPGTEIIGNLIHAIHHSTFNHGAPNNGLYFDEGSKYYYAANNVIYDISHTPLRSHRGSGVSLENNYFIYGTIGNGISHSPPYRENMILLNTNDTLKWDCPEYLRDEYDEHMISLYQKGNHFVDEKQWDKQVQSILTLLNIQPGILPKN